MFGYVASGLIAAATSAAGTTSQATGKVFEPIPEPSGTDWFSVFMLIEASIIAGIGGLFVYLCFKVALALHGC